MEEIFSPRGLGRCLLGREAFAAASGALSTVAALRVSGVPVAG